MSAAKIIDLTLEDLMRAVREVERPLLLTRSRAAELLGVDRHHVAWLVQAGHLKAVRVGEGDRYERVPREDVERLAREGVPSREKRRKRAKTEPAVGDLSKLEGWEPT